SRTSPPVGAQTIGCGAARSTCSSGATEHSTFLTITAGACSASPPCRDPTGPDRPAVAAARRASRGRPGELHANRADGIPRSAARRMADPRRNQRERALLVARRDADRAEPAVRRLWLAWWLPVPTGAARDYAGLFDMRNGLIVDQPQGSNCSALPGGLTAQGSPANFAEHEIRTLRSSCARPHRRGPARGRIGQG